MNRNAFESAIKLIDKIFLLLVQILFAKLSRRHWQVYNASLYYLQVIPSYKYRNPINM